MECRLDGGQKNVAFATLEREERCQAFRDQIMVRREWIVGQGFPVGKMQHRQVGGKEPQFLLKAFGALAVGGQEQGEAPGGAGGLGNREAQGGTGQIAPVLFTCRGREFR